MNWLMSRLPFFTRRDWDNAYETGVTVGYLRGYRLGVEDGKTLEAMRASTVREVTAKPQLRIVKDQEGAST